VATQEDSVSKLESIQLPLVNKFYKRCGDSAKAGRGDIVYVVRRAGAIVAAVRLQERSSGSYFLRSMCVAPELRRQGVGGFLLAGMREFLDTIHCYCYPFSHLDGFYSAAGFQVVEPDGLPDYICAPLMRYRQQGRKLLLMVRDPKASKTPQLA